MGISIMLLAWEPALAQSDKPLAVAGAATCAEPQSGSGISGWVASKLGFSAAAELRVNVVGADDKRHCTTSWILHVRRQDGQPESITIAEREDVLGDNEWIQENSFEVNAWSSDGSMLLASQIEAKGDWDETTPIVYDFNSGQYWHPQLHPLFKKYIPADCYVVYDPLGFAQDGTVLISAMSTDDDREPGTKPCFGSSRWYLDFRNNTISRASPSHPEVKRP
jgi:hypothetical protein